MTHWYMTHTNAMQPRREVPRQLTHARGARKGTTQGRSEFARDHLPDAVHLGKGVPERDVEVLCPNLSAKIALSWRRLDGGSRQ